MARNYSNTALDTTLTAGIGAGDASLVVASATGYPAAPFAIVLDPGMVTEEAVQVTVKAGTTFTISRGFDGTTAAAHSAGATVRHAAIASDFTDLQAADANLTSDLATKVPTSRTLTINGDAFDLSADRSWIVGGGGTPGGADTQVQFNDAGAFAGDAGLTYADRELTITGDEDKATPLLMARSGDFHATAITETFVPNADIRYTAVDVGTASNDITITYSILGISQPLSVVVVGLSITAYLATDGSATPTSTASDVIAALTADLAASALVVATLAPGNDGTGVLPGFLFAQLSGGATAADTAWIDERGQLNIQLQTGLGVDALNIRNPAGTIVAHIDTDGGGGFAEDRVTISQTGDFFVNATEAVLSGNIIFKFSVNGFGLMSVAAGGGYGFSVASPVPGDIVFNISAATGQTADLFVAFDESFVKTVRILPNGDMQFDQPTLGPILIDRTTADRYRLYVDSGVLGIEAV